jgi:hypothetical protein
MSRTFKLTRNRRTVGFGFEALEPRCLLAAGTFPGVPSVVDQFAALQSHADALAFTLPSSIPIDDTSLFDHYQGVVRYPGAGSSVFYVTQSDGEGGYLHTIQLSTRGTDGERLRSNLQYVGVDTEDARPSGVDRVRTSIRFDGSFQIDGQTLRRYKHPGGMAIVDNILFVPMDSRTTSDPSLSGGVGAIVLFDLGNNGQWRTSPRPIQVLPIAYKVDNLAVIKHKGTYLIYTNGDGGEVTRVYRTSSTDLRSPALTLNRGTTFSPSAHHVGPEWPTGSGGHQSSTFIRQSNSENPSDNDPIYMIATRMDGFAGNTFNGNDYADLYRVTFDSIGQMQLEWISTFQPTMRYSDGGTLGNFAAAGSAYVSPSGELLLYSTPHYDIETFRVVSGSQRFDLVDDNVRIAEIGHRNMVRNISPLLKPSLQLPSLYRVHEGSTVLLRATGTVSASPWVELFDDTNFGDRSLKVAYVDRAMYELNEFDELDRFTDKASSVRWRLPVGMRVELFDDDNFSDTKFVLEGNGLIRQYSNLGGFGDKTSSMRFVGSNPAENLTYDWDLDGDGIYGETGTNALRGDEVGQSPRFNAGISDGPSTVVVYARVTDGTGASTTKSMTVQILNLAPTVSITGPDAGNVGVRLSFQLTATDPSWADRRAKFRYVVDFGNGVVREYVPKAANSSMTVSNTYTRQDLYVIRVTAIDKDGGVSAQAVLQVAIGPVING